MSKKWQLRKDLRPTVEGINMLALEEIRRLFLLIFVIKLCLRIYNKNIDNNHQFIYRSLLYIQRCTRVAY